MKTLEIIHLRLEQVSRREIIDILHRNLKDLDRPDGLITVSVYCHEKNDTDLCIQLIWKDPVPVHGSDIALQFVYGLQVMGIVNHTVWRQALRSENPSFPS